MKKIIITLTFFVAMVSFWSCEEETLDIATGTVNYPVFVNSGNQLNVVALGENFTVPEIKVFDGEKDITSSAIVEGEIDLETPGYYPVTYTATTADGYTRSYELKVYVYHPDYKEAPIAGVYAGNGADITIEEFEKGVFLIDDATANEMNAWYGRNDLAVSGTLIYIGNMEYLVLCDIPWFGWTFVTDGNATYSPADGSLSYHIRSATWDPYTGWDVVLTPIVE